MDLIVSVFYAGVFIHLWGRGRPWHKCVFWPLAAGKEVARWLDRLANESNEKEGRNDG